MLQCFSNRWMSSCKTISSLRQLHASTWLFESEAVSKKSSAAPNDILDEFRKPELTEEEIMRMRFKSRLPERIYRKFIAKEALPIENKADLHIYRLRRYYARHGSDSKLNPGICWPTREEITETIEYDKIFEPPLQQRIQNVEARRLEVEKQRREVEDEVDRNMANLDKWISEHHGRFAEKEAKARQLKLDREKLVEEISEYLGYDIDHRDPRFKEAVEQRNKEKKKALKVRKQQEGYEKMLEKLRKIAENK